MSEQSSKLDYQNIGLIDWRLTHADVDGDSEIRAGTDCAYNKCSLNKTALEPGFAQQALRYTGTEIEPPAPTFIHSQCHREATTKAADNDDFTNAMADVLSATRTELLGRFPDKATRQRLSSAIQEFLEAHSEVVQYRATHTEGVISQSGGTRTEVAHGARVLRYGRVLRSMTGRHARNPTRVEKTKSRGHPAGPSR